MSSSKICGTCNLDIKDENTMVSCGKCSTQFHQKCVKLSVTSLKEITKNKSILWLCVSCSEEPFSSPHSNCFNEEKVINAIRDLFSQKILDIDSKCNKINNKLDNFIDETEGAKKSTEDSIKATNADVEELKRIVETDRNIIDNMGYTILNLQRNARSQNLLLDALPENVESKQLNETIIKISTFLKYPLQSLHIESCFRIKKSKGKLKSVLVKFANKSVRDGFYGAYLKHGNLKLSDIFPELHINSRLYFNEHLTQYDQYLMNAGTKLRYKKLISACFSRSGNIYFRKEVNGKAYLLDKGILAKLEDEGRNVNASN